MHDMRKIILLAAIGLLHFSLVAQKKTFTYDQLFKNAGKV